MKQIGSVTITLPEAAYSETGTPLGAPGSAESDPQIAAWLARRSPDEVDRAAVSRASQRHVDLRMRREWRYPEGRPSYEVVVACEAVGDEADRSAVLADVSRLMTPAPQRQIEGWLAELSVLVARRPQDEVDEAIRLTAYAGRLAQYPADVARAALLDTRWQFWPTWAELASACDGLTSPRRHMLLALSAPVEPPIARRLVPEEERRRIHDMGKVYDAQPRATDLNDDAPVFPHWSTRVDHATAAEQIRRARAKAGNLAPSDRETEEFEAALARSREIRGRTA